jgi:hypothetical protein
MRPHLFRDADAQIAFDSFLILAKKTTMCKKANSEASLK